MWIQGFEFSAHHQYALDQPSCLLSHPASRLGYISHKPQETSHVQFPARVEPMDLPTQYFAHEDEEREADGLLDTLEDIPIDDAVTPRLESYR